jgi:hypothetical protein
MNHQTQALAAALERLSKATADLQRAVARGDFDHVAPEWSREYNTATQTREAATRLLVQIELGYTKTA